MESVAEIGQPLESIAAGAVVKVTDTRARRSRGSRRLAVAGAGLAGILLGGFPVWAAHRILYPVHAQPLPHGLEGSLTIENGVGAEYVEFDGRDGGRLSGWFVPPPAELPAPWPTVLLVYGYGSYKEQMAGYAQLVHDAGFASLMFDMRGSGLRRDEPVTLGYKERWDMLDAARYLRGRSDVDANRIGALGVSMGAATALLAAEADPTIRAIVADSAYARLQDMVQPGLRTFIGTPATLFAPLIVRLAETMLGMKSSQVQPAVAASKLGDRALFVIHGADDPLTNPKSASEIFSAASGPKELWMIPACGHAQGPAVSPDEYKSRIASFLTRYLGAQ
jgi:fermentation-respiration switch protein FrsA (DUF1100 family)